MRGCYEMYLTYNFYLTLYKHYFSLCWKIGKCYATIVVLLFVYTMVKLMFLIIKRIMYTNTYLRLYNIITLLVFIYRYIAIIYVQIEICNNTNL